VSLYHIFKVFISLSWSRLWSLPDSSRLAFFLFFWWGGWFGEEGFHGNRVASTDGRVVSDVYVQLWGRVKSHLITKVQLQLIKLPEIIKEKPSNATLSQN